MPTTTGHLAKAWIGGIAALITAAPAGAVEFVDDPVKGSCKALVRQQGATGVHGRDRSWPGLWGATEPLLLIGDKRIDAVGAADNVEADLSVRTVPATRGKPASSCVAVKNLRYTLRAETRVTAMEWQHGRKPDSACAKEWDRMRAEIRVHELKHVQDIDETIRDENARTAATKPIEVCAATSAAARSKAGSAVRALLAAQAARLTATLKQKAAVRDRERSDIDCTKCAEKVSFKDVTLDCTLAMVPQCVVTTGQIIAGEVCGDPTTNRWKISSKGFVRGCGANQPPTADKPFDNDCVPAGSDIERMRIKAYRDVHGSGAGGWMCVYDDKAEPTVTIRWFRSKMCSGEAEQAFTVKAEVSACDAP